MNQILKLGEQPWQKVFLFAIVAAGIYYFVLFDNGSALDAQLAAATAELETTEKTLKETQSKMKDIEKFSAQLSDLEAQVTEVMQFLPKEINLIGLMQLIQDAAKQAGLSIRNTTPNKDLTRKDFYEMQKVTMTMQGTYVEVTKFLSLLSKLPRLVTVDSMKMVASADRTKGAVPSLDFEITVVGYRFVDEVAPATPPEGGAVAQ